MKKKINNRKILESGAVILDENSFLESLFSQSDFFHNISVKEITPELEEYNKWAKMYDRPQVSTDLPFINHEYRKQHWFIPQKYLDIDLVMHITSLCKTSQERDRALEEIEEYAKRDLLNVLKFLIYIVDLMKKHDIVSGVGRGSSVSSFVLYLIEVHHVNSIKYGLDWREFLRD